MSEPGDVPAEVMARLRPICQGLPEVVEEPAWIGIRWRVRARTFAHVYTVDLREHPHYGRSSATGPVCLLRFHATADELGALVSAGHPFHRADWGVDVVLLVIDDGSDWDEVGELLTESYRTRAPKRLAARIGPDPG